MNATTEKCKCNSLGLPVAMEVDAEEGGVGQAAAGLITNSEIRNGFTGRPVATVDCSLGKHLNSVRPHVDF